MIDWLALFFNSLWILALAGLLSAVSMAYFAAQQRHISLRKILNQHTTNGLLIHSCLLIFSIGLAGTAGTTLERILWIVMALIWGGQLVIGMRRTKPGPG